MGKRYELKWFDYHAIFEEVEGLKYKGSDSLLKLVSGKSISTFHSKGLSDGWYRIHGIPKVLNGIYAWKANVINSCGDSSLKEVPKGLEIE